MIDAAVVIPVCSNVINEICSASGGVAANFETGDSAIGGREWAL